MLKVGTSWPAASDKIVDAKDAKKGQDKDAEKIGMKGAGVWRGSAFICSN
jgi:hypothetical protein